MSHVTFPPLHTRSFTPFGAPKAIQFRNFAEAGQWLRGQKATWELFHEGSKRDVYWQNRPEVIDHKNLLNAAERAVLQAEQGEGQDASAMAVAALMALENAPYLSADANGVCYIFDALQDGNTDVADSVFNFLIGNPVYCGRESVDLTPLLRAAAQWRDGDRGLGVQVAMLKKDINARLGKWESEFSALGESATGFVEQARSETAGATARQEEHASAIEVLRVTASERLDNLAAAHEQSLSALHTRQEEQLTALHRDWDAALAHIERTYTEHLRLKAPADFWREKAMSHKQAAQRWLWALLALLGVGLVGVAICYVFYLYDWIEHLSKPNAGAVSAVLVGLPVLLYLSLVKVAHKSYRDEGRHAADAEQRTTLVQTYLALVNDNDHGVQNGERLLALHAVFRGSAQADGPDDTPPVNTLEALVQGLKPKGA